MFRPAPSKREIGHWEKTISEKGAYEVHAILPVTFGRKFNYLELRLAELCRAKGMNNFDPVGNLRDEGLRVDLPADLEEVLIVGFCYPTPHRRDLGVELERRTRGLTVTKVGDSKQLQEGDVLLTVSGREVNDLFSVLLEIFELPASKATVPVTILRGDSEVAEEAGIHKGYKEVYDLQDYYSLQRDFQP
jgi:hypothetical protein